MDKRDRSLASLRAVLALCEAFPDLPVPSVGEVCLMLSDDGAGLAEIDRIAAVLRAAGRSVSVRDERGHVDVIAGEYRAFYVRRHAMADYHAHMSYVDNVHADPATVAA
jgi:hypothetical protein